MKFYLPRLGLMVFATLFSFAVGYAQNVSIAQPLTALARPANGLVGLSPAGALLRSTNNGTSWTTVRAADATPALYTLAASGSTLVAMGDDAYFVRSTDDGQTWTNLIPAQDPVPVGSINAVAANGTTWVAVGQGNNDIFVLRSTDSGATWSAATIPVTLGSLHGITYTGTRWVAVGGNGVTGFIYTSTDGASWTALTAPSYELYAVASDGAGKVLVVGDVGTMLYATDHAATSGSFTGVDGGLVSEALRSVSFLSGSNWIAGGDSLMRVSFNGTTATKVAEPSITETAAYTVFSTGTGTDYYYAPAAALAALDAQGSISLQIASASGQLQLTLVGAQNGYAYHLESSTTLSTWTSVSDSTRYFLTGNAAPSWLVPLPSAGARVFYRVKVGSL
jgi:photosystem II stability/assembly factor-like uncharacterized protein